MRIAFVSNFLNHHQLEFCEELMSNQDINFVFIATTPVPEDRLSLGYSNMNDLYDFVLKMYESPSNEKYAQEIIDSFDVVITGSAPWSLTNNRIKDNKVTFRYSERVLKGGRIKLLNPRILGSMLYHHTRHRNRNVYLLCASAYTASDFMMVGAYPNKAYKWGYFPKVYYYSSNELTRDKKENTVRMLWVGRFLKLKDPLIAIKLVNEIIKSTRNNVELTFIGEGPLLLDMKKMIDDLNLNNYIKILPPVAQSEVRNHMLKSDIFLFTSNLHEGWGAVLNESMNSGCAVVASHAIGSVPFLIEHKKNGLIYKSGSLNSLVEQVQYLLENELEVASIGKNAYETIINVWNAKTATTALIHLFNSKLNGDYYFRENGPTSQADWIPESYSIKEN